MSKKYTTDNITIDGVLNDGAGNGTSGQVLSSTATGVSWIDGSGISGGPYLPLSAGSSFPLTGALHILPNYMLYDNRQNQILNQSASTVTSNRTLSIGNGTYSNIIIPSGNAGIGTTNPVEKLHVSGGKFLLDVTSSVGSEIIFQNNAANQFSADKNYHEINFITSSQSSETTGGYVRIKAGQEVSGNDNSSFLGFWTAANGGTVSEKMRIDSAGNVLINHTAGVSETKLYVEGSAMPLTGDAASVEDILTLYRYGSNTVWAGGASLALGRYSTGGGSYPKSRLDFKLKDAGGTNVAAPETTVMTMHSNGNVGIGTTSPVKKLQVSGSATGDLINMLCVNTHDTNGDTTGIGFSMTDNDLYNKAAILFERTTAQGIGDLHFAVNNTASNVNVTKADARLTIKPNGNVGIGTTDPERKLHVNGSGGTAAIQIDKDGDKIAWLGTGSSGSSAADDTILQMHNEGVEKVRLFTEGNSWLNGGNVGIGTTNPAAMLDVQPTTTNRKVTRISNDVMSTYFYNTQVDAILAWTCGSYYQAEVVITANQTNGGTYNNLYIRGIWSNNHTSHHWNELEHIGGLTGSTFTISVGQDGATTASGRLELDFDYSSGSFSQLNVRVTDFYGTHSYTIT